MPFYYQQVFLFKEKENVMFRRKLAAMLDGLVNVGSVDCTRNAEAKLCEKLGRTEGVVFFPPKAVVEKEAKVNTKRFREKNMFRNSPRWIQRI